MSVTVYTAITGKKDELHDDQTKGKANFHAFLDFPFSSKTWDIKNAPNVFNDPRRNSRIPKILAHQYVKSQYSIYIDGNIILTKPPEEIIERYLKNHDIALFKHPKRDCIYDEAMRCAVARLDDPEVIIRQVSTYEADGYAKHKGLCECGVLIRRHTPKVEELNNAWFSEYTTHSVRDQISFMYAADKVGIRLNVIDSPWFLGKEGVAAYRNDFIKIVPHTILNPLVNG